MRTLAVAVSRNVAWAKPCEATLPRRHHPRAGVLADVLSSERVASNIAEVHVQGPIDAKDYEAMLPTVKRMLRDYDQISLLMTVESLDGVTPKAMWEDMKMAKYVGRFGRMAVVTDKGWMENMTDAVDVMPGLELHHFEPEAREATSQWLKS